MIYTAENNTFEAIKNLVGGNLSGRSDGTNMSYDDEQTPPSQAEIDSEIVRMQTEWDSQEYARTRAAEYPDTGEQFIKIYDDGLTKWKSEMVDPVKTKWPKDNSGPVE